MGCLRSRVTFDGVTKDVRVSLAFRSAVELVKIVRETLEALFDLHLGIPEEVVASAGQGLDAFLQRQDLDQR